MSSVSITSQWDAPVRSRIHLGVQTAFPDGLTRPQQFALDLVINDCWHENAGTREKTVFEGVCYCDDFVATLWLRYQGERSGIEEKNVAHGQKSGSPDAVRASLTAFMNTASSSSAAFNCPGSDVASSLCQTDSRLSVAVSTDRGTDAALLAGNWDAGPICGGSDWRGCLISFPALFEFYQAAALMRENLNLPRAPNFPAMGARFSLIGTNVSPSRHDSIARSLPPSSRQPWRRPRSSGIGHSETFLAQQPDHERQSVVRLCTSKEF